MTICILSYEKTRTTEVYTPHNYMQLFVGIRNKKQNITIPVNSLPPSVPSMELTTLLTGGVVSEASLIHLWSGSRDAIKESNPSHFMRRKQSLWLVSNPTCATQSFSPWNHQRINRFDTATDVRNHKSCLCMIQDIESRYREKKAVESWVPKRFPLLVIVRNWMLWGKHRFTGDY